jgi:hypothetical protein
VYQRVWEARRGQCQPCQRAVNRAAVVKASNHKSAAVAKGELNTSDNNSCLFDYGYTPGRGALLCVGAQ